MAKEKSFEDRRREREREDLEESRPDGGVVSDRSDKIEELISRALPLIEQVNGLYNQFMAGIESRPPVERRKQLDQMMQTVQAMGKPTAAAQFRFSNLQSSYSSHKERWDRLMKDLESGKLKRKLGSKSA